MDIREIEMRMNWTDLAQDRDQWWALVNKIYEQFGSIKHWEFFEWLVNCWLLKKDSPSWT
jgi:hypothetical protein